MSQIIISNSWKRQLHQKINHLINITNYMKNQRNTIVWVQDKKIDISKDSSKKNKIKNFEKKHMRQLYFWNRWISRKKCHVILTVKISKIWICIQNKISSKGPKKMIQKCQLLKDQMKIDRLW